MKKTKNEPMQVNSRKLIILLVIVSIMIVTLLFYPYFKPRGVLWCNFEQNVTDSPIPRNECVHMQIISRDVDKIDVNAFESLNITNTGCYQSYDELPSCSGDEYHFTQYELSLLSEFPVDGTLCIAYYVEFYESHDVLAEGIKDLYRAQNFKSQIFDADELKQKLIDCEVR